MQNRLYNPLFLTFYGLSFLIALASGGPVHNVLAAIDLILIFFVLYETGESALTAVLPALPLGFLNGSLYLTLVGIYTVLLTLVSLFSPGLFHFVLAIIGIALSFFTILNAKKAYDIENTAPASPAE